MELTDHAGRRRLVLPAQLRPGDIERLRRALGEVSEYDLVTLEGSGGVFCEGGALPPDEADTGNGPRPFGALLSALERKPGPVVALVDGVALGAGVGLAAAADLVLSSPDARFGLPETLLGLIPAMVFPVLARRIGAPRARLLALGHPPLSADQARDWGLVDEVTHDLEAALRRHQRRFTRMGPQALASLKALVADHFGSPAGYTEQAASCFAALLRTPDARGRIERTVAGETPWPAEEEP